MRSFNKTYNFNITLRSKKKWKTLQETTYTHSKGSVVYVDEGGEFRVYKNKIYKVTVDVMSSFEYVDAVSVNISFGDYTRTIFYVTWNSMLKHWNIVNRRILIEKLL